MNKKIGILLLGVLTILASRVDAQILYKVESPSGKKTSWLLGTHHFAPLSAVDSIKQLPEIVKSVDALYGEIDMQFLKNPAALMGMQQKMVAPVDSALNRVLSVEQLDSVRVVWDNLTAGAIPLDMLYGMRPAVVSAQLSALLSAKALPELNPLEGIDATMQERARQRDIPVLGLETVDFQVDMLYGNPIAEQARELMKTVREIGDAEQKAVALSKAYIAHDIDSIYESMTEMEDTNPGETERLIYSRNDSWVKILTDEMAHKSLLVVVGAGHLPGPRGVIEGLKTNGFKVTPVE